MTPAEPFDVLKNVVWPTTPGPPALPALKSRACALILALEAPGSRCCIPWPRRIRLLSFFPASAGLIANPAASARTSKARTRGRDPHAQV